MFFHVFPICFLHLFKPAMTWAHQVAGRPNSAIGGYETQQ